MKKSVILISLIFFVSELIAQPARPKQAFELEVDPIAYLLNGYSLHGIYHRNHLRFDLGVYGIEQPEFAHGNEGFEVKNQGVGLKVNYLFKDVQGFYAGVDGGYASTQATFNKTGEKDTGHSYSLGVHAGYRFFPFLRSDGFLKGLYINPWAGIGYSFIYDEVKFPAESFKENKTTFFPTIHIGYRFSK